MAVGFRDLARPRLHAHSWFTFMQENNWIAIIIQSSAINGFTIHKSAISAHFLKTLLCGTESGWSNNADRDCRKFKVAPRFFLTMIWGPFKREIENHSNPPCGDGMHIIFFATKTAGRSSRLFVSISRDLDYRNHEICCQNFLKEHERNLIREFIFFHSIFLHLLSVHFIFS